VFPLSDEHSGFAGPALITILLIVLNIGVFVFLQGLGTDEKFTYSYATVPQEIVTGKDISKPVEVSDPITGKRVATIDLQHTPIPVWLTIFTSMFMHGGLAHIFGNMLFLWIFGDNLEHAMGSKRFLSFYLLCGIAAALAQVGATLFTGGNPYMPMIGASGAISGVLAGYLILFPRQRVNVLIGYFITTIPAFLAIGLWFAFQLINGLGVLGNQSQLGGVAYAAHIGGFLAGLLLVRLFANKKDALGWQSQRLREIQRIR
jgi:membrane associated rhomboid family serine protease